MIEPRPFRGAAGIELRKVELTEPSTTARFPIGTVIVCPAGHEVAEFGCNIHPAQLISTRDIVAYREGQQPLAQGSPDHQARNPRCHCGRRWTRLCRDKGAVSWRDDRGWPEIHTADGWR